MKGIKTPSAVAFCFGVSFSLTTLAEAQVPRPDPVGKPLICVVLPDIQLGQGTSSAADRGGPVVASLVSYLSGPAADVQVLQSRIAVQFTAEAALKGCSFIAESSVVQKKAGKGMAGLLAAAPSLVSAIPFVGGTSGSMEGYAVAQAASAAVQGVAAVQGQQSQEDALAAMSGIAESNITKGDQITLTYRLYRTGSTTPIASRELKAKAADSGEDILSPLLEQMATELLGAALTPAV